MTLENQVTMYSRAWYGDEELTLTFPESWEVKTLASKDAPRLSEAGIEAAFGQPIGTPRISEMARGKSSAAIVVDDLSRPTPAAEVIPFLLRELSKPAFLKTKSASLSVEGHIVPSLMRKLPRKLAPTLPQNMK